MVNYQQNLGEGQQSTDDCTHVAHLDMFTQALGLALVAFLIIESHDLILPGTSSKRPLYSKLKLPTKNFSNNNNHQIEYQKLQTKPPVVWKPNTKQKYLWKFSKWVIFAIEGISIQYQMMNLVCAILGSRIWTRLFLQLIMQLCIHWFIQLCLYFLWDILCHYSNICLSWVAHSVKMAFISMLL